MLKSVRPRFLKNLCEIGAFGRQIIEFFEEYPQKLLLFRKNIHTRHLIKSFIKIVDQISIKTSNPKCLLYRCLNGVYRLKDTVSHVGILNFRPLL